MELANIKIGDGAFIVIKDESLNGEDNYCYLPGKFKDYDIFQVIAEYDDIQADCKKSDLVKVEHSSSDIKLLAPVSKPRRNIFCVGKNYKDHIEEMKKSGLTTGEVSNSGPEAPIIFSKVPETVIAHLDEIPFPSALSACIDYETELGVIIGKKGKNISYNEVDDYIFGFTIINDVTARDLQVKHKQWLIGKSLDGFCPMGPCLVTSDEINYKDLNLKCHINGELRQSANTSLMIFDIPTIIETISKGITLYPGDVIATGTPSGVGSGFDPKKFLKPGDEIVMEIEGIGILKNTVR